MFEIWENDLTEVSMQIKLISALKLKKTNYFIFLLNYLY